MSENHIRNVVEAALLAAGKSLPAADLAQLFDEDGRPEKPQIVAALQQLESEYAEPFPAGVVHAAPACA